MHNTIFLGPFLGLFMDNAEVKEAAEKAQSQDLSFKAAVKLAEVSLSLGDGRLSDAGQQAEDLRSLATELPPESRLQTLALSMQVTTQLARVRNDDAMQAAMELLTAQSRQDKQAEAAAWLRIAEVHRRRTRCKQQSDPQIFTPPALVASVPTVRIATRHGFSTCGGRSSMFATSFPKHLFGLAVGIFRSLGFLHRLTGAVGGTAWTDGAEAWSSSGQTGASTVA